MKKFLVVLLILAVAGGLFAQGLTLSGGLKTGLKVFSNGGDGIDETTDTFVQMEHSGDDENRLDIGGIYTAEDFGVKFNFRFTDSFESANRPQDMSEAIPGVSVPKYSGKFALTNAYVWADFLRDIINVKAGQIDDGVWTSMGDKDWNLSNGTGIRAEVKPIEGLNVGMAFVVGTDPIALEDISNEDDAEDEADPDFLTGDAVDPFKGNFFLGGSYSADKFAVSLAMAMFGKADDDLYRVDVDGDDELDNIVSHDFTAIFGINIKAVENLIAIIEGRLSFAEEDDFGAAWFTQKVEYAINDKLSAGIIAHEKFLGADLSEAFVGEEGFATLMLKLYGKYAINEVLAGHLDIEFNTISWQDKETEYDTDTSISFKPKLTYQVGPGAEIAVFDKFVIPMLGSDIEDDPKITNQFQIDFTYTF
jgi:hypothetical protein